METICIGVCTAKRPLMLRNCLNSLAILNLPTDYDTHLIVTDNETQPTNQKIVSEFAETCPFPVHYIHEPRRGIPFARNAVLDKSINLKADWIAFIDDDETADQNWLSALMAPEYKNIPILGGIRQWRYPEPTPFWALSKRQKIRPEEAVPPTCNFRFSCSLTAAGLRFNEVLGLWNGSDREFFEDARKLGFEMGRTQDAITIETAHLERLTYHYQVYLNYCRVAANTRLSIKNDGLLRTALTQLPTIPAWIITGTLQMLTSPIFVLAGLEQFKKRALTGGKKIAKGLGRAAAILGHIPQHYTQINGH